MEDHASSQILDFCSYSMSSSNPKTVFTAAVVTFNHVLTYKRDLSSLSTNLFNLLKTVIEILSLAFT